MKYLMAVFLCVSLTACSFFKQPGCFIQDQAVNLAADVVASTLECSGKEAIKTDLTEVIGKLGLCKASYETGALADAMCPLVVSAVVGFTKEKVIPSAWQCSAAGATGKLSDALLSACKAIPVSQQK